MFVETRQLAQEWTYRFFGAALEHALADRAGGARVAQLEPAGLVPHRAPTPAELRDWARNEGMAVSDRGRVPSAVLRSYLDAHGLRR